MVRSWQNHGKILQDLTKILQELAGFRQEHGKIMVRSWLDLDKVLPRSSTWVVFKFLFNYVGPCL